MTRMTQETVTVISIPVEFPDKATPLADLLNKLMQTKADITTVGGTDITLAWEFDVWENDVENIVVKLQYDRPETDTEAEKREASIARSKKLLGQKKERQDRVELGQLMSLSAKHGFSLTKVIKKKGPASDRPPFRDSQRIRSPGP